MGVFERLGVKVLGTQIRTLEVSEDRDLFVKALDEIGIPAATSTAVSTVKDALEAAEQIGYPVILRSAFSLGGLGSGFAENEEELRDLSAKSLSLSPQVLIEKSLKGWKELEYEVVRDAADNVIICCNMEVSTPTFSSSPDALRLYVIRGAVTDTTYARRTSTRSESTPETRSSLRRRRPCPTTSTTCSDPPPSRLSVTSASSASATSSTLSTRTSANTWSSR